MNTLTKFLIAILFLTASVSAQTLKSIMESNKFIMAPVNFWTQQPYSGPFSNAVNAVVVHPEGGGGSNIFSTNYFITTTNVFVELNTNFTSLTYYFVTNLISVQVGGEQLWGTNTFAPAQAATGGITNKYGHVNILEGNLYLGNEVHRLSSTNTSWFYEGGVQILPGGATIIGTGNLSVGNGGWRINNDIGSAGQASFGHVNQYGSNYFQIITDSNGPPAFNVTLDGVVWVNHPLTVGDVQTNLNLAGTGWRFALVDDNGRFRAGLGTNALSGLGGTHYWFTNVNGDITNSVGDVVVENGGFQVSNQQTNTQQAGTGVRIAVFDPNGKLYAGFATNAIGSTNIGGSGFVLEYTNSSPITEGVFPTTSNSPSIAYKRGGLGTTFTWNTVTFTWE